jgi:hypothetical protein
MMKYRPVLVIFAALSLVLVACQAETEPTVIPGPVEESATAVPVPTDGLKTEPATEVVAEEEPVEPAERLVVEPPTVEEAGVLPMDQFYIDTTGLSETWAHTLEQGITLNLGHPPGDNGIPPHIVVSFGGPDEEAAPPQVFSPAVAQGRIYPVQAYKDMYETAGSDSVKTRIEALTTILEERPETIESEIPVLPIPGHVQLVHGKINYIDFNGGAGIGFVAAHAPAVSPIFDHWLHFLFQGLTDDGHHWVSFVWPLTVNFLPSAEEATQEYLDKADQDPTTYLEEVSKMIEEAADSDFDPVLVALNRMMQSMVIGESAQGD